MTGVPARITAALIVGVAALAAYGLDQVVDDTRACDQEILFEGNPAGFAGPVGTYSYSGSLGGFAC